MPSKYSTFLKNKNFRRWHENVARGSKITANNYLRVLGRFCQVHKLTPEDLIRYNKGKLKALLLDAVAEMEMKKYAGSYIAAVLKSIRSWLSFNNKEIRFQIKIRGAQDTPTLRDERVPTQEELRRIFQAGDLKTRAACAIIAQCGLRLEVLGNYEGTDGLRISDFPEMEIAKGRIEFKMSPCLVRVRADLSKTHYEYFTFMSAEASDYLKAYLEMRMRDGEKLTGSSAIITPKFAQKEFIRTLNIGDAVRKAIRQAGFPWRPYVLRSYFATQMMLAESKGLIIRDYRSFFMGHKGDIEAVYTLNKRRLPPDVVEQMRDSYAKAQRYLQTVDTGEGQEELTKAFKRQLLLVAGFKGDDIKDEQLDLSEEEFQKLVREKLLNGVQQNQAAQRVVALHEIESRLQQGWEFVSLLPDDKAIIKFREAG